MESTTISGEPVSYLNNDTVITITGMEPKYHKAAVDGKFEDFQEFDSEQIGSILTPNKNTILHVHFTNHHDKVLETFVEKALEKSPALFLRTNAKGETILHVAGRYGHHKIVKKLFELAKDPKYRNEVGAKEKIIRAQNVKKDTALHEAARYNHSEVVDMLIKEEPDHLYFGKNVDGETPLYIAVERQHWNVVNRIFDNMSTSPQYSGPNGRNALHVAALYDVKGVVLPKLLGKNPSAAKEADKNGWVPLHLAAIVAIPTVVEELVREGRRSTAYMRDKKGRTALHFAAICGRTSIMEKILEHCPDCCELVDEKGYNALHYIMMGNNCCSSELKQLMKETPLVRNLCNEDPRKSWKIK